MSVTLDFRVFVTLVIIYIRRSIMSISAVVVQMVRLIDGRRYVALAQEC